MPDTELARISASPPRRALGFAMLLSLGALLIYLALSAPPQPLWQVFMIGLGGLSLWTARLLWRATEAELILTDTALTESGGEVIARIDDIVRIERGMLAAKPSNGFALVLKTRAPRAWRPGLWWRLGRKVAVGGVTAGSQTRPVADIIAMKIAERREQP